MLLRNHSDSESRHLQSSGKKTRSEAPRGARRLTSRSSRRLARSPPHFGVLASLGGLAWSLAVLPVGKDSLAQTTHPNTVVEAGVLIGASLSRYL
jgi:hypothetical protein